MRRAFIPFLIIIIGAVGYFTFRQNKESTVPTVPHRSSTPAPISTTFRADLYAANKDRPRTILPTNEEDDDDDVISREQGDIITSLAFPTPTPTLTILPSETLSSEETPSAPHIETDPQIAALREIQSAQQKNQRSRGGPPLSAIVGPTAVANPLSGTPAPTPTRLGEELPRVSGEPRGYVMLYLMHPKARETVEKQLTNMLRSQVNDLYLGVLVDGTFGQDFEYLSNVVQRLNTDGRTLTLTMYFASGPTMRRFDTTPVRTIFSQINPFDFRYQVENDSTIRDAVSALAQKARPVFELNRSLSKGNQNFAIPMLEDNLDRQSYQVMRALISNELQNSAQSLRNPCLGCFSGNDAESLGDSIEMHRIEEFDQLSSGDGYTLDGENVAYPGEDPAGKVSITTLRNMLDRSVLERHRYFGLWRAERQGLPDSNGQRIHPDDRNYEIPTEEQSLLEISLLRQGLTAVVENSSISVE